MAARRACERPLAGILILTSLLGSVSFCAMPLFAEEASEEDAEPASSEPVNPPPAAPGGPSGAKVNLNEVEIQGELEKPKIFFILPKAQRDAETKTRQFRFYPDILEPLDKDRFEEEARVLYQHGIPAE